MGGDTSNSKRIAKHPQMGGDTSNPKRIAKHLQMGGDTQLKLPISQWGRHFKPQYLETDNLVEALNRSTQQTIVEEDGVLK